MIVSYPTRPGGDCKGANTSLANHFLHPWRVLRVLADCRLGFTAMTVALGLNAAAAAQTLTVPDFFDPQHHFEKPDISTLRFIHFITEDDYPPFDFLAPDGSLAGFNVDLARAICDALQVACTVQPRRWDTIVNTIESGGAEAAIASIAITAETRKRVDFTAPYYKTPARFVARRTVEFADALPETLAGKIVGVEARTAHEAYLRTFFPRTQLRSYENAAALRSALKRNEVGIIFDDGISLAIWLNGTDAAGCCEFRGGPFTDTNYFGDGAGIAVKKGNITLRRALNYTLQHLAENGVYADLYLKYFPIGFY
jgi:polar amino acid transport system substrate-binding protein